MASAAIRTLAKVKSSAMTARQPSVPNLICGWGMIGFLFSLGTMVKEVSADEWSRWRARGFPAFVGGKDLRSLADGALWSPRSQNRDLGHPDLVVSQLQVRGRLQISSVRPESPSSFTILPTSWE